MEDVIENVRDQIKRTYFRVIKRELFLAILIALILVVAGVFLGDQNNKIVPVNNLSIAHYHQEPNNRLSFMANWDGPDYLSLATQGYKSINQTNYFPLYPLLIRLVHKIIPSALDSALLVAWCALVGSVYFYLKVIKRLFSVKDNVEAVKGLLLFLLFPTGVFLIATYTESLFALLALGSIYFALNKKVLPAALFALFATATHVNGLFLLVLVVLMLYEQKVELKKIIAFVAIGSLGIISYMFFLLIKYHKPLAFIEAQQNHGWLQYHTGSLISELNIINVGIILLLIASVLYWWKRRKSFSIYSFLYLCIPIIGGQMGGFNRYALMAYPVQFMLYNQFRNKTLGYALVIALFTIFWTHYLFQYAGGYVGG